ncbi:MAG: Arc family DNA-binding protein [Steroidobacteraceae bacterium]
MSLNLSIKSVPDDVASRLRARAERNHRSLQGELMAIICAAAADQAPSAEVAPAASAHAAPRVKRGWKTLAQVAAEGRECRARASRRSGRSVELIRQMRDSR